MSDKIPSMTESRIDIIQVLQAHKEHEATALMSAMVTFETELKSTITQISQSIQGREASEKRVKAFNDIIPTALRLGANDLVEITRRCLTSHTAGKSAQSSSVADALVWLTIAEQTRVANIALFQSCQLFGRALNGKRLPPEEQG